MKELLKNASIELRAESGETFIDIQCSSEKATERLFQILKSAQGCHHDFELIWPLDPREWECGKCGHRELK